MTNFWGDIFRNVWQSSSQKWELDYLLVLKVLLFSWGNYLKILCVALLAWQPTYILLLIWKWMNVSRYLEKSNLQKMRIKVIILYNIRIVLFQEYCIYVYSLLMCYSAGWLTFIEEYPLLNLRHDSSAQLHIYVCFLYPILHIN